MKMYPSSNSWRVLVLVGVLLLAGCAGPRVMMPTPKLYGMGLFEAYDNLDPALQSPSINMLYVTDRKPVTSEEGKLNYGFERSPSIAFGEVQVRIDAKDGWKSLVADGKSLTRSGNLNLELGSITELGRAPPTPYPYTMVDGFPRTLPEVEANVRQVTQEFRQRLRAQLARTSRKEVILFVHGVANTFADAAYTTYELWNYLGREGVPIVYTWPAGFGGALRGYAYDSASSKFTVYHLKQFMKLLGTMPEVEGLQIIAHSRGTAVVTSAFRELLIEARARGDDPRKLYKVKNMVLAAPDIEIDVLLQRTATEYLAQFVSRMTVYTSKNDKAIGLSTFLFGGLQRLGQADGSKFPERVRETLEKSTNLAIIEYTGEKTGGLGHDYFRTNPAVASDLVLAVRYNRDPGAQNGRPLKYKQLVFWAIDDSYLDTEP